MFRLLFDIFAVCYATFCLCRAGILFPATL
jgi:hypothetical protein